MSRGGLFDDSGLDDAEVFGRLVRRLRLQRGLRPHELAKVLGENYSHWSVGRIERGEIKHLGQFFRICRSLGITVTIHTDNDDESPSLASTLAPQFRFSTPEDAHQAVLLAEATAERMYRNNVASRFDPREDKLLKPEERNQRQLFYEQRDSEEEPDDEESYSYDAE